MPNSTKNKAQINVCSEAWEILESLFKKSANTTNRVKSAKTGTQIGTSRLLQLKQKCIGKDSLNRPFAFLRLLCSNHYKVLWIWAMMIKVLGKSVNVNFVILVVGLGHCVKLFPQLCSATFCSLLLCIAVWRIYHLQVTLFWMSQAVLGILNILVRIRIRIPGPVPLTNGSESNSGSHFFLLRM